MNLNNHTDAITKELSKNDTGETGAHQAGILIPKNESILSFFPSLEMNIKNPRQKLTFIDDTGERWVFSFIYYNNKYFGGTRNEYRLTGMTKFFRACNLKAGDSITLKRDNHRYLILYHKIKLQKSLGRIKLGSTWKVISF